MKNSMFISIKGAKENNLKNVDLLLPRNKLIVFTGLSGSGKSTMALETLQRECQRQYMESMGMMMNIGSKPKVDSIEGLSPAISINQHHTSSNPRSTVGTATEISTFLRILYAKLGERPCPHCGKLITQNYCEETVESSDTVEQEENELYEQKIACPTCGKPVIELTASHFSYNKPQGACASCKGIGVVNTPDVNLLIDGTKSIKEYAIYGWDQVYIDRYGASIMQAAKHYGFEMDINTPVNQYDEIQTDLLLYGVLSNNFGRHFPDVLPPKTVPEGRFEGVVTNLLRRYAENSTASARQKLEKFLIKQACPECKGVRYRKETLEVRVKGINIKQLLSMSLFEVQEWLKELVGSLKQDTLTIVQQLIEDLNRRIERIISVGAGYLSLNQPSSSLSAGEWQRIKLASILGSGLTGVLYVLDEPTAGLHSRDTGAIISVLRQLRDMGNTVIVIEHDMEIMKAADHIVDFGPGAGAKGGRIVVSGNLSDIISCGESITGKYLQTNADRQRCKRAGNGDFINIRNATHNNLKNCNVKIPLGRLVTVTGVSGSGKSSLIFGTLAKVADMHFKHSGNDIGVDISGLEHLNDVIMIDQQSIGRSNRSNAATYTDIFTDIRDLFASLPATRARNLSAKHFSYNVAGGRCEKCQGSGKLSISMHFLPDVEVVCPVCRGKRYQKPVLEVKYKGNSISDVLEMSIDESLELFSEEETIATKLRLLKEVGLGYLKLGQSATTLSGGEAQRLKLAKELTKSSNGRVMYLFDEPTTGLHPHDASKLIRVFDRLLSLGNSVVVIEHNTDIIRASDWVIDLGPEGGKAGGEIIAQGTPGDIMSNLSSITGRVLSDLM
ncbi:MAG TPA: excinuclease ABC subunit UvrA [Lachnospiraceae bacterium]|nr:excinuclease ABC subunit UvrA [Lachnospiraceae bacterium]